MRATAVKDGDEYILNGTKTFITNGAVASVFVGFFKTIRQQATREFLLLSSTRTRRA